VSAVAGGERRIVSVLVADIAGSTAIAERLGPERSKFLFDDVVRLIREEVERLGGTVAQLTGDGVLALFGAPTSHEDDSERAVRAALAIHEALARYAIEVGPAYGIDLAARVAVNTGPVVVPSREAPADELYNALGDTVNVAARLQSLAGDGGVAVGPETARQLREGFELEPLGDLNLKGKEAPVAAYRVSGERVEPVAAALTPLVGREAELAQLDDVLSQLVEGRGAIVTVTGEPGIGKSRLKSEARARFGDRVRFLEGHAVAYAHEIPYWPLRELLRNWLELGVSDPEARVRLELRAGLADALDDEAAEAYPFLASVLGLPLEPEQAKRLAELSRDSVQQQTFDAARRLTSALAAQQPLCLVLEDLHWADEATLALLEELFAATDRDPVMLLLSYRTEHEHAAWDLAERAHRRYRHRFVEVELAPLDPTSALGLAAGAAGAELPRTVAALLAERSGGNPFFLEEAFRDLLERGVLRRENGRYELANGASEVAVPTLVQEALQARLDRLAPDTREVISVASVVGRSFAEPLLEEILPPGKLQPALSELQRLDLVVEERRRPAPEYRFRHGLVQEVAYDRLVTSRRRELHRIVGEALERLHPDSPQEVYGLLARHFTQAGDPTRAVDYLLKAGDAARALYAEDEALDLYTQALGFMEQTGDQVRARETLLKVALAHHLAYDFERAGGAYREAFRLPRPEPVRLRPTEVLTTVQPPFVGFAPGHTYHEHGWELCRHLFRGLIAIGPNHEITPEVAESFTISGDGTTYQFRIAPDAHWSDGMEVTAEDFALSWRAMRDEQVETAHLLDDVESAEALDARTLEVRLVEPGGSFLYLFGQPPLFAWPMHVRQRLGERWHESVPLIGNGPFVLVHRDGKTSRLVASETWQGARGNAGELALRFWETPTEIEAWWREGDLDAAPMYRVVESEETVVESTPALSTDFLAFRDDRAPLGDPCVRRALAHAVDRDRWSSAKRFGHDSAGSGGLVPPTMPGHSHRVAPAHDPDRAREGLAEAGFPGGRGLRELTLAELHDDAGEIAVHLEEVGVRAKVVRGRLNTFKELIAGQADAFVWGWNADYPDHVGMITGLMNNFPAVHRTARTQGLLARTRSAGTREERLAACREFERAWIGEEAALVPLAYNRRTTLLRPWIEGFWQNGLVTSTFSEVIVRPERRSAPRPA